MTAGKKAAHLAPALREDPLNGDFVLVSSQRGRRPSDMNSFAGADVSRICPFCGGNEALTPPEILALRPPDSPPDSPGWSIRVIPNKYPALARSETSSRRATGLFEEIPASGFHEVIVETPEHKAPMGSYSEGRWRDLLWVYRNRLRDHYRAPGCAYVQIFRNFGPGSGASLEHPHTQLVALPRLPASRQREYRTAAAYRRKHGRELAADLVRGEIASKERIILATRDFAAFVPFAARIPYETWISPRNAATDFGAVSDSKLAALAAVMSRILRALELSLPPLAFNLVLHSPPPPRAGARGTPSGWRFQIFPRTGTLGGFELATGCFMHSVPPETAADLIRSHLPSAAIA